MTTQLIPHEFSGKTILQRESDGFINATAMCKACNKLFADYRRLKTTGEFLTALSADMGIPISLEAQIPASELIQSLKGGKSSEQGTWVHPDIAIHLAQWLSPQFAVQVSRWVREWIATGQNPVPQTQLSLAIFINS